MAPADDTTPQSTPASDGSPRRAAAGAIGIVLAVAAWTSGVVFALGVPGTAYEWQTNLLSDLGDSTCRVRDTRWVCSPGFAAFNAGLIGGGVLVSAAAVCLLRLWGSLLGGSVVVMGLGLVIAGLVQPGDPKGIHLVGVILALVVPGLGLVLSGVRPGTRWLRTMRVPRVLLGSVALVFCAESRLNEAIVPRGAGELVVVGCLVLALILEATRAAMSTSARHASEPRPQRRPVGHR